MTRHGGQLGLALGLAPNSGDAQLAFVLRRNEETLAPRERFATEVVLGGR